MSHSCPIVIFFESHFDKEPTYSLTKLLGFFKSKSYNIFAAEDKSDQSLDQILSIQKNNLELLANRPDIDIKVTHMIQDHIIMLEAIKKLDMNFTGVEMTSVYEEELSKKFPKGVFNFLWEIGEMNDIRNNIMVSNIDKACKKFQQGIIFLVGANHCGIQSLLQQKGYTNIISFGVNNIDDTLNEAIEKEEAVKKQVIEQVKKLRNGNINKDYYKMDALYSLLEANKVSGARYVDQNFPTGIHYIDASKTSNVTQSIVDIFNTYDTAYEALAGLSNLFGF